MPSGAPGVAIRQIPTLPTQFSDLTPSQLQAVQALATGANVTAAAEAAGVHRDTIYEWRRALPAFAQAVEDAKAAYETHLHDQLAGLAQLAMAAIRRLLEDPATPPAIQLRAALAVLRQSHFEHRDWNIPAPAEKLAESQCRPTVHLVQGPAHHLRQDTGQTIPRSGPCPCGSGRKYKRCCGQNAPPVLHGATAA
ncbi:MAG: SEC-C metal-binding domain-containing protein [Bryobacteraceae bacterium]